MPNNKTVINKERSPNYTGMFNVFSSVMINSHKIDILFSINFDIFFLRAVPELNVWEGREAASFF